MPKVKNFHKVVDKETGGYETFDHPIYVDSKGVFTCQLPDNYRPFARTMVNDKTISLVNPKQNSDLHIQDYKEGDFKLASKELEQLEWSLGQLVSIVARSSLKRELVIMYKIDTNVTYAKDENGQIIQRPLDDDGKKKKRAKNDQLYGVDMDNLESRLTSYNVGVYAVVAEKTTQEGTTEIKYDTPCEFINGIRHTKEFELNNFLNLAWPREYSYKNEAPQWKNLKEMPYTEEREQFFIDMMLAICKLADRIAHLQDHEAVLKIADSGKYNLLAGPKE